MPHETVSHRSVAYDDSHFIDHHGIDVHVQANTMVDGPAVVLHHHFYGSSHGFRHVLAALDGEATAIAIDRPGFGLTERPRARTNGTNPYSRAAVAAMTQAVLEHFRVEQGLMVGSSAGGTAVLEHYRRHPERVAGMVLLSPAISGDVGPPAPVRPLLRNPVARRVGLSKVRQIAVDITPDRVGRNWHDASRVGPDDVAGYSRPLKVHNWDIGFWELIVAEPPPRLTGLLARIDVPTWVVAGAQDTVITPFWNRRTARAIPGAEYVEIPDVGHTPHEESPQAVVEVIRQALAAIG